MIMEIKPTYVTGEQAKLLKEKGLIANCKRYWVKYSNTEYKEMSDIQLEDLDREIGIGSNLIIPKYEQWQVVEWALKNYNIWISVQPNEPFTDNDWCFKIFKNNQLIMSLEGYDSPKNAYIEAINKFLKMI